MRELWEVEWKEKSRDGIEIIGGLIKENTLEELKETMEFYKKRTKIELIKSINTEFGEIIKRKYE